MLRATLARFAPKKKSSDFIRLELAHSAKNYKPCPVVFASASGVYVRDPENKRYVDFMSGYGSVNQGHLHPAIVRAASSQLKRCTLSCRAYHNDQFPVFAEKITKLFGYDKVLPMNTGAEAVETAIKIAKKWSYRVKNIPAGQAKVIAMSSNFHGRTHLCISLSDDPDSYSHYEPLLPGIIRVPYGDKDALAKALQEHGATTAAIIAEPVQGEAGVIFPPDGFLRALRDLATKHNVLWIDDEIQAGLGRTGYMLAVEHENVRPDIVILAKALGGGIVPVSCALADAPIMDVITPGTHGSTFGGNPMASAIAMAALDVLVKERLPQKSKEAGVWMKEGLESIHSNFPKTVESVRNRGLWGAVQFFRASDAEHAEHDCVENGLLVKRTHDTILRLAPPLIIKKPQMREAMTTLFDAIKHTEQSAGVQKAKK